MGIGRSRRLLLMLLQCLSLPHALSHAATGHSASMENHRSTSLSPGYSDLCKVTAGGSWHHHAHKTFPLTLLHSRAAEILPRAVRHPRCLLTTHPLPMGPTASPAGARAAAPQQLPRTTELLVPRASNAPAFAPSLWNRPMGPPCCIPGSCGVRTEVPSYLGLGCFFTVATLGMQRCRFRYRVKCWHGQVCAPRKPLQGLWQPQPGLRDIGGSWGQLPSPSKCISVGRMADAAASNQN